MFSYGQVLKSSAIVALVILSTSSLAGAVVLTSQQDGPWYDQATWGGFLPTENDAVIIVHDVVIPQGAVVVIGQSIAEAVAVNVEASGTLTLGTTATIVCRGHLQTAGVVTLGPGAILELDDSLVAEGTIFRIDITPGNGGGRLQVNGTLSQRCTVRASLEGAHTRITNANYWNGGGRVVASYCDFSRLGGYPDYQAIHYITDADSPMTFTDCTFDQCGKISLNEFEVAVGSHLEFNRCRWTNSTVKPDSLLGEWEEWYILQTSSAYGAIYRVIDCDFDERVFLHMPRDMEIEDCVFRDGVLVRPGEWMGGVWQSFERNFVRWVGALDDPMGVEFGCTIKDCILVGDDPDGWNPHFMYLDYGTGNTDIIDNVFWWSGTAPNAEGDGVAVTSPSSGTMADNIVTISGNLFLPNGNGPDGTNNISCTGFSLNWDDPNRQIVFKRNTVYSGNGTGGCNIGETQPTTAGVVAYLKSNIFVGGPEMAGLKLHNMEHAEIDAVLAENADYNAGYRLANGSNYGNGSGKGYEDLYFSGSQIIGEHDLDNTNPQFVDPHRTPASWAGSLEAAMDRLSPGGGFQIAEVLTYIRDGFRPQNTLLRGAGDPADGSPDIGAVPLAGLSAVEPLPQMTLSLDQNHPNPFNPTTTIVFTLTDDVAQVDLAVYDLTGRLVARLLNESRQAGRHEVQWRGRDLQDRDVATGVYVYRLHAGGESVTAKMTLQK